MRAFFCDGLFRVFGHWICCGRIPEWWEPIDVKPLNLYNVIWRAQQWVACGMT